MYDAVYYECSFNIPYNRSEPHWRRYFGALAEFIKLSINPRDVLDVGCAKGFLVEQLRLRNVPAWGFDLSEYAVRCTYATPFCWVARGEHWTISRHFDLITCIELVEHLRESDALKVLDNICAHARWISFSSSPTDTREPTHVNVRPARYWIREFFKRGFVRNERKEPRILIPWGMCFERF